MATADPGEGWGTAAPIEIDESGDAWYPRVAIDDQGNAIAVWHQHDGVYYNIWANHYDAVEGWGIATVIDTENSGNAVGPQVGMDDNGNAIAIWSQNDGVMTNITSNRYVKGAGWGPPELAENYDLGSPFGPHLAVDRSGNAMIVWQQFNGSKESILSNRYEVGIGWGTPELVETDDTNNSYVHQVGLDASGNAIAVWVRHNGTSRNIMANRYVVGSGWGTPLLLENYNNINTYEPRVAVSDNGNAMAIWRQHDGLNYNLWVSRYEMGTGWDAPAVIEDNDVGSAYGYHVEMDDVGNAMVIWHMWDGTWQNLWAKRYDAVTGWGTSEIIETVDRDTEDPELSMNGEGIAMAIWTQNDGSLDNIWSNRYEPGFGWRTATLVETDSSGHAVRPHIAVSDNGNAVAAWQHTYISTKSIWANYMDVTPPFISITGPTDGTSTEIPTIFVSGVTEPDVQLTVNGIHIDVTPEGTFEFLLPLTEGINVIKANATDAWANWATDSVQVTYVNPVTVLEEELRDIQNELNETKKNLTAVENDLQNISNALQNTETNLTAIQNELGTVKTELDDSIDTLEKTRRYLEDIKHTLNSTQNDLNDTKNELDDMKNTLATLEIEFADVQDELANTKDELETNEAELDDVKKDLDAAATQILLLPLGILVILIIIQFVLYMNLAKKIGRKGQLPSELPEEPSQPESAKEHEETGIMDEETDLPPED